MNNLFANLPKQLDAEQFDALLATPDLKIERILSHGQVTPEGQWYDQAQHEWVLLLQGAARLQYEDGSEVSLNPGTGSISPLMYATESVGPPRIKLASGWPFFTLEPTALALQSAQFSTKSRLLAAFGI